MIFNLFHVSHLYPVLATFTYVDEVPTNPKKPMSLSMKCFWSHFHRASVNKSVYLKVYNRYKLPVQGQV